MMQNWLKIFGGFFWFGLGLIVLGKHATQYPEIRNFAGGGPLVACYVLTIFGTIFFVIGLYGVLSILRRFATENKLALRFFNLILPFGKFGL